MQERPPVLLTINVQKVRTSPKARVHNFVSEFLLNIGQVFRVARGNAGFAQPDHKPAEILRRVNADFIQQKNQAVGFRWKLIASLKEQPLQRLLDCQVTHKDGMQVSTALMHVFSGVDIVISLPQPFLSALFHTNLSLT